MMSARARSYCGLEDARSMAFVESQRDTVAMSTRSAECSSRPTYISIPVHPANSANVGRTASEKSCLARPTSSGSTAELNIRTIMRSPLSDRGRLYGPRASIEDSRDLRIELEPALSRRIVRRDDLAAAGVSLHDPDALVVYLYDVV